MSGQHLQFLRFFLLSPWLNLCPFRPIWEPDALQVELFEGSKFDAGAQSSADPVPSPGRAGADNSEAAQHLITRLRPCLSFVSVTI